MRNRKRVFWIVGVIIALVIAFFWLCSRASNYVEQKLPLWIDQATDSLYDISVDDVHVNLMSRSATLENVRLSEDTARLRVLTGERRLQPVMLHIEADECRLSGLQLWNLFFRNRFNTQRIELMHPTIIMHSSPDSLLARDSIESHKRGLNVHAQYIELFSPTLVFVNDKADSLEVSTQNGNWRFSDVKLSVEQDGDSSLQTMYLGSCEIDSVVVLKRGGEYQFSTGLITISENQKKCTIENLKLGLAISREQYYRRVGQQTDVYNIVMPQVSFAGLDVARLFADGAIFADQMNITDGWLGIHMDRRLPQSTKSRKGKFPNQVLLNAPVPIFIKALDFKNCNLRYTEVGNKTEQQGEVSFTSLKGKASNITNVPEHIANNNVFLVDLQGKAFNISPIEATFEFMLDTKSGAFRHKGHQGSMDITQINETVRALSLAEFESMKVQEMYSNISGDDSGAKGEFIIKYTDLKARVLGMQDEDLKTNELATFISRALFIHPNNPMPGEEPRVANVSVDRDPYKSFFNLIWKCIYAGALETALKNEKMAGKVFDKPGKQEEKKRRKRD